MATGKARVHELAKELGVTSKEVLARLSEQGEFVKSASSTVEAPVARRLREAFGGGKPAEEKAPAKAPAKKPAAKAAESPAAAAAPAAPIPAAPVAPRAGSAGRTCSGSPRPGRSGRSRCQCLGQNKSAESHSYVTCKTVLALKNNLLYDPGLGSEHRSGAAIGKEVVFEC